MSLLLDDMRREFAQFLATDPGGRFRMDAALAHVVRLAYERGISDGAANDRGVGHAAASCGRSHTTDGLGGNSQER